MQKTAHGNHYPFTLLRPASVTPNAHDSRWCAQTLRIMRMTTIILLAFCMHVSASGSSQSITLSGKSLPLKTIFKVVEQQTGYVVFYQKGMLKGTKPVSIEASDAPLDRFLRRVLDGQELQYEIINKTIILSRSRSTLTDRPGMAFLDSVLLITGRITDEKGEPVEGATVMIRGTRKGTVTGADGRFSIAGTREDVLVVSVLNYRAEEIKATASPVLLQLTLSIRPLDEMLVGGNVIAHRRKAEVSSVTTLTSKEIEALPVQRVDQLLTGIVPGVFMPDQSQENLFNGGIRLSIRGANSFSGAATKIYVDGIELAGGSNFIGNMDKNSIERIEVVRGPSAATLYGSNANGGVILIFTKKGSKQSGSIDARASAGFINSKWVDKAAFQQEYAVETAQGFGSTSYRLGGVYRQVGEYLPNGKDKTYSSFVSVSNNAIKKLDITVNAHFNQTEFSANRNPTFDDIKDSAFRKYYGEYFNPRSEKATVKTAGAGLRLNYQPFARWTHNLVTGLSHNYTLFATPPTTAGGGSSYWYNQPTVRYNNNLTLGDKKGFELQLLSGAEYTSFTTKSESWSLFSDNNGGYFFSSNKNTDIKIENHGFFGQGTASLRDRYFLTLAYRFEKSNTFSFTSSNPKIGFTTNFTAGGLTIKPRISWGKGISLPPYAALNPPPSSDPTNVFEANPDIKPQEQTGMDYGVEIYGTDSRVRFEAVYFNNLLKNANFLAVRNEAGITYNKTVNIGKIRNSGLELSGSYATGHLRMSANFSMVKPIIQENFSVLGSEFKKGDAIWYIPKYTYGAQIGYNCKRVFGPSDKLDIGLQMDGIDKGSTINLRGYSIAIFDWVQGGYIDPFPELPGFVTTIPSVVHLNMLMDYQLHPSLHFFIQARNILNNYRPALFNTTPIQGANYLFGLKYHLQKASS